MDERTLGKCIFIASFVIVTLTSTLMVRRYKRRCKKNRKFSEQKSKAYIDGMVAELHEEIQELKSLLKKCARVTENWIGLHKRYPAHGELVFLLWEDGATQLKGYYNSFKQNWVVINKKGDENILSINRINYWKPLP